MNTVIRKKPDLFGRWVAHFLDEGNWVMPENGKHFTIPAVNVKENKENVEIEVAAPGLKKEDFNLEIDKNLLKISVDKTEETVEKEENFTRKEFNFFNFKRSFTIPEKAFDAEKAKAEYNDGILKISLPKVKEAIETVRKIKVG